jgi:hypothetical protein
MVTFDLNPGSVWFDPALAATPKDRWSRFLGATTFPYQLTVLTSGSPEAPNPLGPRLSQGELAEWSLAPGSHTPTSRTLGLRWPPGLISLSHVAIPYRPDDPVYGLEPITPPGQPVWPLGATVIRGEAGATPLGLPVFNRLRSNPFWPYMAERIDQVARADAARGARREAPAAPPQ